MKLLHRRSSRGGGASGLASSLFQALLPTNILLLMLLLCAATYFIYMHAMVTTSLIGCGSSNNSITVPDRISSREFITAQQQTTPSSCQVEYNRITATQTPGITKQDKRRSQAWIGNQYRLTQTMKALSSRQRPVNVVVAGGSISLGHGVTPTNARYAERLEKWMNDMYPLQNNDDNMNHNDQSHSKEHKVINVAAHGADMCSMAKRLNILYQDLSTLNQAPDLIILEFAVNDYQGQDHIITVDSKTTVFFDGFRELVLCAEAVIHSLRMQYPNTALVFLEFRTAIATRKTGALLHMGVANHYQIPVISYAEALFPDFWRLKQKLEEMDEQSYSFGDDQWLVNNGVDNSNISSAVLPYPHGCAPCQAEHIIKQFRPGGCKSMCTFLERSGIIKDRKLQCKNGDIPKGRNECYVPFFAHDAIHPSAVGHTIAKDLIVHTLATAQQTLCNDGKSITIDEHPLTTFVADDFNQLKVRSDYLVVKDVARTFSRFDKLERISPIPDGENGFTFYADDSLKQRPGWIATNPLGDSRITFDIDLPLENCYAVYVAILRSYTGMGTFRVEVKDYGDDRKRKHPPKKVTTKAVDGLWESPISVWSDVQITEDNDPGCTGYCEVTIITNPQEQGRNGNKVKILTLSARKCSSTYN